MGGSTASEKCRMISKGAKLRWKDGTIKRLLPLRRPLLRASTAAWNSLRRRRKALYAPPRRAKSMAKSSPMSSPQWARSKPPTCKSPTHTLYSRFAYYTRKRPFAARQTRLRTRSGLIRHFQHFQLA